MHYTHDMLEKYIDKYGNMYLELMDGVSLPDNLNVVGRLNLFDSYIERMPDSMVVGDDLILYETKINRLPENLVVGGDLDLRYSNVMSLPDNLIVGGRLILTNTQITRLPENLTVGEILDISGTGIVKLPDNLTVGGNLCIANTGIYQLPKNLKIGGRIIVELFSMKRFCVSDNQRLHNGDYVPNEYIYCDGLLTFIKNDHRVGEYTYYRGMFPNKNVIYDGTYYAHCKDLKSGIQDLMFKHAKDRGSDQFKNLTKESEVSKDDAIIMYRIITGACRPGTEMFINSINDVKDTYTIQEIINLTRGRYCSDTFEKFFN